MAHDPRVSRCIWHRRLRRAATVAARASDAHAAQHLSGLRRFPGVFYVEPRVKAGETVAVVGPNGPARRRCSESYRVLIDATAGEITMEAAAERRRLLRRCQPWDRARAENGGCFRTFGRDNLSNGRVRAASASAFEERLARVYKLFPRMEERRHQPLARYPAASSRLWRVGRALMSGPKLCCCTTLRGPQSPWSCSRSSKQCADSTEGYTVLIVEQNIRQVLKVASRVICWNRASPPQARQRSCSTRRHQTLTRNLCDGNLRHFSLEAIVKWRAARRHPCVAGAGLNLIFGVIDVVWSVRRADHDRHVTASTCTSTMAGRCGSPSRHRRVVSALGVAFHQFVIRPVWAPSRSTNCW